MIYSTIVVKLRNGVFTLSKKKKIAEAVLLVLSLMLSAAKAAEEEKAHESDLYPKVDLDEDK